MSDVSGTHAHTRQHADLPDEVALKSGHAGWSSTGVGRWCVAHRRGVHRGTDHLSRRRMLGARNARRAHGGLQRPHRAHGTCAFVVHTRMPCAALLYVIYCLAAIAFGERRKRNTHLKQQHQQRRAPTLPMRYSTQEAVQNHPHNSTACTRKALTCRLNCASRPDIAHRSLRRAARARPTGQALRR